MTSTIRPETGSRPGPGPLGARIGWLAVTLLALAIAAYAVAPYVMQNLRELADAGVGVAGNYVDRPGFVQAILYAHIGGGAVALVIGPFQFWRGLRERRPHVHRILGRIYLVAVAVGGIAGLLLAPVNEAGWVGLFGFGTLAVLWLITGWRALVAIRRRDIPSHRAWMMRNFALTFAAVTLRLWLPLLITPPLLTGATTDFSVAFADAYAAVPFLCWLPNLVIAEILIRRRGLPSYRVS